MTPSKKFLGLCSLVTALGVSGCDQVKLFEGVGYVPVSRDEIAAMPAQPVTVVYGYDGRVTFPATSPLECFNKAFALFETRKIFQSGEPYISNGRATCLGENGVVLMVYNGKGYAKGKLVAAPVAPR